MCQIFLETRMFSLSDGEEIMTLAFFVLIQYRSVTDGQTDGRTDGHLCSGYTSACIARYANGLVKMMKDVIHIWQICHKLLTSMASPGMGHVPPPLDFQLIFVIGVGVY